MFTIRGTLSGNPVAMAGGIAQLKECLKKGFYKDLEKKTTRLVDGIMKDINKSGSPSRGQGANQNTSFKIFQIGSIFWPAFTNRKTISAASEIDATSMDKFKILHAELLERGIYLGPSGYEVGFVSSAHTNKDIDKTIKAFKEALKIALK